MDRANVVRLAIAVLAIPVLVIAGCNDRFRYPCQDPENWDKEYCKKPLCEVNRNCPEHIFKSPNELNIELQNNAIPSQGVNCGK